MYEVLHSVENIVVASSNPNVVLISIYQRKKQRNIKLEIKKIERGLCNGEAGLSEGKDTQVKETWPRKL